MQVPSKKKIICNLKILHFVIFTLRHKTTIMKNKTQILFASLLLIISSCRKTGNSEFGQTMYQSYIKQTDQIVSKLSPERKQQREKWLNELKTNSVYVDLVQSESTSEEYLIVLSAVGDAIKNTHVVNGSSQFGISDNIATSIENSENGEKKMNFVIALSSLTLKMNGGLPKEIIPALERFRKRYGLYGDGKSEQFDSSSEKLKIKSSYNLSYIFALFDSSDKKVLDAIFESVKAGISDWNSDNEEIYENKFMSVKTEYMKHLKKVYPDSPYLLDVDFEITAIDLFRSYQENEVAADEKYKGKKLAIIGTIGSIGKDIMDDPYISFKDNYLGAVTCYFSKEDNNEISKLRKEDRITIVGQCEGLTLTNVILKNCRLY